MSDKRGDKPRKIVEMFEEGRRFTEELLEENKRLRLAFEQQRNRIKDLEQAIDKDSPELRQRLQLLEEQNLLLKEELRDVKERFNEIEKENWDFSERYLHVERQNSSLLNLYVASQRLHSTLSFRDVIQIVKELIVNLIGSEAFDVCLYDGGSGELQVLAALGTTSKVAQTLEASEQTKRSLVSGNTVIPEETETQPDGQAVVACVPLKLGDKVLGAIIIRELLVQKPGIERIDHELFDLLGEHAVSALCASFLFTRAKVLAEPGNWKQTCAQMSQDALELEGTEIAPTVVW
jgi:DNA-binding transcriptional MerR regulator